jgi:hypothetical protein
MFLFAPRAVPPVKRRLRIFTGVKNNSSNCCYAMQMYLVYNLEPGSGMLHSKICN